MPSTNAGHGLTVAANTDKQKDKSFSSDGRQFSCMLKPTVMCMVS